MNKVNEIFAFIATDTDEGVLSFTQKIYGETHHFPMVGSDKDRVSSLREKAKEIAQTHNTPLKLVRFTMREDIEQIWPPLNDVEL